jgi:hypothetical protein
MLVVGVSVAEKQADSREKEKKWKQAPKRQGDLLFTLIEL